MIFKRTYIIPLILLLYTLIGLWITPDYGFSIDEAVQRDHGLVAMHYVSNTFGLELPCIEGQKEEDYRSYSQRYYGNIFQMVAISLECIFDCEDWRSRYLLRHYLVFLLFCASAFILYKLLLDLVANPMISFLCLAIYLSHPRIFAHAHYNPKDLVLLSVYVFAIYSLYKVYINPSYKWLVIHGCLTALVINVRIVGLILIPITLFMLVVCHWKELKKTAYFSFSYLAAATLGTIALWPLLWSEPLNNFVWAFKSMSQFPWLKDLIYWGEAVPSIEAPWTYVFSWIGITTPVIYLLLFILALLFLIVASFKAPRKHIYSICLLGLTIGPVAAVLILDSILYGDWRHLYFIYPGLVLITAVFLSKMENTRPLLFKGLCYILLLQLTHTVVWIVNNHPYQYNYFNILGNNEIGKHEQDYWGLSYKNAMEKLVDEHLTKDEKVIVGSPDFSAYGGYNLLDDKYKKQLTFSWKPDDADYFVTNYRTLPEVTAYKNKQAPYKKLLFQIKVDEVPISGVYKKR